MAYDDCNYDHTTRGWIGCVMVILAIGMATASLFIREFHLPGIAQRQGN